MIPPARDDDQNRKVAASRPPIRLDYGKAGLLS
jgi:hypothetical protein